MNGSKEFGWNTSRWTRTISTKNAFAHTIRREAYASLRILVKFDTNCEDDSGINNTMLQCCGTTTGYDRFYVFVCFP